MKSHIVRASILASVCCICAAAMAENPFVGTWKLDPSQSKLAGDTFSFAAEPGGKLRISNSNVSYVVAIDGSASTNPMGMAETWTKPDDHTWKSVRKGDLNVVQTGVYTLSNDGKTLEVVTDTTKPNGDVSHDTESYTRIAPGDGLIGTWKGTSASSSNSDVVVIDANGDDGMVIRLPQWHFSITLKFDGKEAPLAGPGAPEGITVAVARTGPLSYSEVDRFKGKIFKNASTTVSEDGKTMTEVDTDTSGNVTTLVYKRS